MQSQIQNPIAQLKWSFFCKSLLVSKAKLESFQTSKTELFAKVVKNAKPFTIFAKTLDVWQVSEYASELAFEVKDISPI